MPRGVFENVETEPDVGVLSFGEQNPKTVKKYLLIYAVVATALFAFTYRRYRAENRRLAQNQTALASEIAHYRTRSGAEAASVQVLRLRCAEFESLRAADAAEIRRLGIKIRRLEAAAKAVAVTALEVRAPLGDTLVIRPHDTLVTAEGPSGQNPALVQDTVRLFRWRDPWVTVEGRIGRDSVVCRIRSVDTLRQVVHRIPRRFLFIRWGTKALRQEIVSTNPHTRIVHAEYVKIER